MPLVEKRRRRTREEIRRDNDLIADARYARAYAANGPALCTPMCLEAEDEKTWKCECPCKGKNHGVGDDGKWREVPDTDHLLVRAKEAEK